MTGITRRAALGAAQPNHPSETFLETLREANQFLSVLLYSDQAREALRLDFPAWLADQFPRFADAFYREYQSARLRRAPEALEEPRRLVDRLLEAVGLRVVDISLGRTAFDSRLHLGRSTTNDPAMPDGAVASVIRNGFERLDGSLAQQAEVIVNRI